MSISDGDELEVAVESEGEHTVEIGSKDAALGDLSISEDMGVVILTFLKPKPISELCAKLFCFL